MAIPFVLQKRVEITVNLKIQDFYGEISKESIELKSNDKLMQTATIQFIKFCIGLLW